MRWPVQRGDAGPALKRALVQPLQCGTVFSGENLTSKGGDRTARELSSLAQAWQE